MGIKMLDHLTVCAINDLLHHDEERSTVEELAGLVRRGAVCTWSPSPEPSTDPRRLPGSCAHPAQLTQNPKPCSHQPTNANGLKIFCTTSLIPMNNVHTFGARVHGHDSNVKIIRWRDGAIPTPNIRPSFCVAYICLS